MVSGRAVRTETATPQLTCVVTPQGEGGKEKETETEADTVSPAAPVASTRPDLCGLQHGGGAGAERRRGRGGA